MVSTDHFRHEFRAQLARAATAGRIDLLVNSSELCRSIANGSSTAASCFEAMEAEFMPGDTLLLDRTNGAGMTVRYLFAANQPRSTHGRVCGAHERGRPTEAASSKRNGPRFEPPALSEGRVSSFRSNGIAAS